MRRALLVLTAAACVAVGQAPRPWNPKGVAPALIAMAQCRTVACVRRVYAKLRHPEVIARLVYYTSLQRLEPDNRHAACGLLRNMPRGGRAYPRLLYLGGYIAPGESEDQVLALGQSYWRLNGHLAQAMKLCPGHLPAFIKYGETAFADPHNDYGDWAAKICRANPKRFLRALRTLSPPDQCYFSHRIIDPHGCKEIAVPEAE